MRRTILVAILLVLGGRGARAAGDARLERLVRVAKVWGLVAHFHPWLRYKDIDWDGALLRALRKEPDREAVAAMLAELHDPATGLTQVCPPAPPPASRWLEEGVLLATAPSAADLVRARSVVIDLRARCRGERVLDDDLAATLASRPTRGPSQRVVEHRGYRTQTLFGGYLSYTQVSDGDVFTPPADARPRRVVFLANAFSSLSPVVLALQQSGDAWIVSEGAIGDETFVDRQSVDIGDGWLATVRTGEIVNPDGTGGLSADVVVAPRPDRDAALAAALRIARLGGRHARRAGEPLPAFAWRPDPTYADISAPPVELRLLALFRYWNVIRYHYAHKPLLSDWEGVLRQMIPVFEAAGDSRAYVLAVAELGRLVGDTHAFLYGPLVDAVFGDASPPIRVRFIEGRPIVTAILGDAPGVSVGDEVVELDGVPTSARTRWLERYLPASNPASRANAIARGLLRGADSSTVTLSLVGSRGQPREVELTRSKAWIKAPERDGDIVRLLPGNLGYIDLDRLEAADLDAALDKVKETRGLILDMRGYPRQGVFRTLGPRLNARHARHAALFDYPLVTAAEPDETQLWIQTIDPTDKWIYDKPTLMLIDQRAASQAEHMGLWLEAASGTRFVGSQTGGTDGGITIIMLPGGISASMTGVAVRHADGRAFQRIGLVPDIPVRSTVAGIRAGRDEVLERAMRELSP